MGSRSGGKRVRKNHGLCLQKPQRQMHVFLSQGVKATADGWGEGKPRRKLTYWSLCGKTEGGTLLDRRCKRVGLARRGFPRGETMCPGLKWTMTLTSTEERQKESPIKVCRRSGKGELVLPSKIKQRIVVVRVAILTNTNRVVDQRNSWW